MTQYNPNIANQQDSDLLRVLNIFVHNKRIFLIFIIAAILLAFAFNHYTQSVYRITGSLMIMQESRPQSGNPEEFINSEIFGVNRGFQNELFVLKSTPVVEQTVKNLDLTVNYYLKEGFRYYDAYKTSPIRILTLQNHTQPVNVRFMVSIQDSKNFTIRVKKTDAVFTNLYTGENTYQKADWYFEKAGKFGELIETPDLAFIIKSDSSIRTYYKDEFIYGFDFSTAQAITSQIKSKLEFSVIDREATVIEVGFETSSKLKGIDIINELMDVYSTQNVNRKNYIANVTIEYIERQLGEISDSLNQTEDNLQQFRSSRQLLNVTDQATSMSEQYMSLQNQMAELVTRKRYYDYLADYISGNKDFSDMIVPSAMGIQDEMLNGLVSQLISAQAQRSNLIQNGQEKNPLVQRLQVQIENSKKTITENILAVRKTTEISIDEMDKRINRIKSEISRVPKTQRQLGGIERKYRLNDAIYNYLLEKRAEAKISQASNQPDNIIIEPANLLGIVSPNPKKNYLIALALGTLLPFLFFFYKSIMSEKIEYQGRIDHLTDAPVLGKIPHAKDKNQNVVFEYPTSSMAEAYRALRTNIEYRFRELSRKVILVTSSIEGEGKSFNALNIAMSYAQLGRQTILVDFDLRKPTSYFSDQMISPLGLSSYLIDKVSLKDIIMPSPHSKLNYIPSGPIPPNPVEMMASDDIPDIIEQLRAQYDCIIIDSPPLAQVADSYLLIDYADIKIIIARYNYTLKKVFHLIMHDLKEKGIENVCVVLNDNSIFNEQYGYGYGYGKKKRSWYKF
jgi:tyrosine-protein kinase Etk/Wzc